MSPLFLAAAAWWLSTRNSAPSLPTFAPSPVPQKRGKPARRPAAARPAPPRPAPPSPPPPAPRVRSPRSPGARGAAESQARKRAAQAAAKAAKRAARRRRRKAARKPADVRFPGPSWQPFPDAPPAVREKGRALSATLWQMGPGSPAVTMVDDMPVGFLAVEQNGKQALSIWRLRDGLIIDDDDLDLFQFSEVEPILAAADEDEDEDEDEDAPEPGDGEVEPEAPPSRAGPSGRPTLMQGHKDDMFPGSPVTTLQKALGMSGQLGFFGPSTRSKVVAFQEANGLDADGVVGPDTWEALTA